MPQCYTKTIHNQGAYMKSGGIMIGTEDSKKLSDFYTKILGEPRMVDEAGGWYGYDVDGSYLMIGPHSEIHGTSKEPQRLINNFVTDDVTAEFERIKACGAAVVAEPYQPDAESMPQVWLATLADPDGNYFQLGTPWEPPKE